MTDKMAALAALAARRRRSASGRWNPSTARHASEPLIIDKWFSLQATIPEPDTLARVKRLTKTHAFSSPTPNRVYALIGAFANGNPPVSTRPTARAIVSSPTWR